MFRKTRLETINFQIQSSDVVDVPVVEGETTTSEVLTFIDDSTGGIDDVGYTRNPIASDSATINTNLGTFFKSSDFD